MQIHIFLHFSQQETTSDAEKSNIKKRLGKNPDVDTSFLPDVDRVR